jgi:NTP pyrophosphatase (non-canonical NTP hydrolase)
MTSGTKPHGWALNRGLLSFFVSEVADLSGTNLPGPDSVAGFCEKSCFGDFIYRSDVDGSLEGDLKGLVLMMGGLLLMGAHFAFVRRTLDRGRSGCAEYGPSMDLAELQDIIERTYGDRDRERGVAATVAWLAEEVGELAQAVRKGTQDQQIHEFGDVIAWIATLANQQGIDLTAAAQRFADGCPKCTALPCAC